MYTIPSRSGLWVALICLCLMIAGSIGFVVWILGIDLVAATLLTLGCGLVVVFLITDILVELILDPIRDWIARKPCVMCIMWLKLWELSSAALKLVRKAVV